MEPISDEPYASVSMFLYSRGVRVSPTGESSGYLEIAYVGSVKDGGQWVDRGWAEDEWDEFASYESYGD